MNKLLYVLVLILNVSTTSATLQINNPALEFHTIDANITFSGTQTFDRIEKTNEYIKINDSALALASASPITAIVNDYQNTTESYSVSLSSSNPITLSQQIRHPDTNFAFKSDGADLSTVKSNSSSWLVTSITTSGTNVITWTFAVLTAVAGWWNSKTGNDATYVPLSSSEGITFKLLYGGITSAVWTVDGVSVGETSNTYSSAWNERGMHYIRGYGITGSGNTQTVEWRVPVMAALATTPVPTLNQTPYTNLKRDVRAFDFMAFLKSSVVPYTNSMGNYFYLFVWVIVFSMYWIRQGSITLPSVLGMILGGAVLGQLPEEYRFYAGALIAIGGVAILYLIYSERK